jgi:hypothetical protein
MLTDTQRLDDSEEIRNYVNITLCEKDHLETNRFPLSEQILLRNGRFCGICFCLHGPRSVCLTAIWDADRNRIVFYSSRGECFQKTELEMPVATDSQMSWASAAVA